MQPIPQVNDAYDRLCDHFDDILTDVLVIGRHVMIYIPRDYIEMTNQRLRRELTAQGLKHRRLGNHIMLTATMSRIYIGGTEYGQQRGRMNIVYAPKDGSLDGLNGQQYFNDFANYLVSGGYSVIRY